MVRKLLLGALAALAFSVSASAAMAASEVVIPVDWPDGKHTIIVAHDRWLPNWLTAIFNDYDLDYTFNGTVADLNDKRTFVDVATQACTKYVETSQPSVFMDILGNIFVFGALGSAYGPAVAAINSAYKGVEGPNSAAVGTSDALGGAADAIIGEGKRHLTFYDCGRVLFDKNRPDLQIHPIASVSY